jgi:hypothetical protein
MNQNNKKMKKLVGAVQYTTADGEKKSHWTALGVAFENRDGSWNLRFDYLPARPGETTIQLRDFESKEDERTIPPQLA